MGREILLIDKNNKTMKRLSSAWLRISLIPIIDALVLLLVVSAVLFCLNEFEIVNLYLGGSSFTAYIGMVLAYIVASIVIAIFDFIKFKSLNNTMIVKENNHITIIKGLKKLSGTSKTTIGSIYCHNSDSMADILASVGLYASGAIEMQKTLTQDHRKTIAEINKIFVERNDNYTYTDYKNCKLVKETKKYYVYVGEKNGVPSKFKIYKVYSDINHLKKGETNRKKIVFEKIFIYTLGFLFCFVTSLNQGTSSSNAEQKFLNNIASIMQTYHYTETECLTSDLKYIQADNSIALEYDTNMDAVKIKTINAEFNLNDANELNTVYSLLSQLYDDGISTYSDEIEKMITDYTLTGEEQIWQDLNSDRQLTLRINKTASAGKDFQLYYSVRNLKR